MIVSFKHICFTWIAVVVHSTKKMALQTERRTIITDHMYRTHRTKHSEDKSIDQYAKKKKKINHFVPTQEITRPVSVMKFWTT